jgi:hypothetical protein
MFSLSGNVQFVWELELGILNWLQPFEWLPGLTASFEHGLLLTLQVAAHVLEFFYQHHLKPKRFRVASAADPLRNGKFHGKGSADTRPRLGRVESVLFRGSLLCL